MLTTCRAKELEIVCPCCQSELMRQDDGGLRCDACSTAYPQRAEVDVLLDDSEWEYARAHLEAEKAALEKYSRARRDAPLNRMYYDQWVARMLFEVPEGCEDVLVELMCGEAEIGRRLPAACQAALCLDFNVRMVEAAAQDLEKAEERRVRVVCGTAARLPIASGSVGAVMIQGGLHHARPLLHQILAEVERVLRPGGVLVASEPANDHCLTRAIRRWQYSRSHLQGNDPDEDGFTRQELTQALAANGLQLERYRQFGFLAYPLLGNTDLVPLLSKVRTRAVGKVLLGFDWLLERVPLIRGMAWASIFRAVKPKDGRG